MKIALVYDRVNKWGGAERILLSLHKIFPDAPLYTSVHNKKTANWSKRLKVIPSFLQKIPHAATAHEYFAPLMPIVFESFDFSEYDVVFSVTSEAAKGIITRPETLHICMCLTPTRYLWSGYAQYFKNSFFRLLSFPLVYYLRNWDLIASKRPDKIIAISENVKKRIKKYYKRDSIIIYPPSDLLFKRGIGKIPLEDFNYFLIVSRLVDYKRIDLAIKACNRLNLPLIIIGEGHEKEKLQEIAGVTIKFVGRVSDALLIEYYRGCRAFLFPGEEDFGITMVEAQHAGKPVIAYAGGGALEIVKKGETGVFFEKQTVVSLVQVLKNFKNTRYNENDCKVNAQRFTETKFKKAILNFIEKEILIKKNNQS